MKHIKLYLKFLIMGFAVLIFTSCGDLLNELPENFQAESSVDYSNTDDMILPLIGAYAQFYTRGWEDIPVISVRGDDVNAGGLGDQQDFTEEDLFNYNKDFWMFNSVWQNLYKDILETHSAEEQIEKYREAAVDGAEMADQYIAETATLRAFMLFQLTRVWGPIFITSSSVPTDILNAGLSTKDEVMQYISDEMDVAIAVLPDKRPNQREDIPGGVTKYTALAMKALANLELKNYQEVANATSQIISSGLFSLEPDFYELFKIPGKLNNENLLELQFSDFGQGAGEIMSHLFAFYGPQGWGPVVTGADGGWGFYEPSLKWIKFMLDREETVRLETSVLFTNDGIAEIKKDAAYSTLPGWISNITPSGDTIKNYARALFASGKHYLPTTELTPGRTGYGNNKNFTCIRYAEVLLMHAEALTRGATGTGMTADEAVNEVRIRAGLGTLSGVTADQVMDEKLAELGMEWGTRFYDMVRLEKYDELSYDGRTFTADKIFLPYPQNQVDLIPLLGE